MCICFVCGEKVKDTDDFVWHECNGDKIHKKCEPNLQEAYNKINSMNDNEFHDYLLGK